MIQFMHSAVAQPEATLAAAAIAAVASILSLFVNTRAAKRAEARAAQRLLVADTVETLSSVLHGNVATASVMVKSQKGTAARKAALARAKSASQELKDLRPKVRITLRLDEPLKILSRVPDWAANYEDEADARELLKRADALRESLDATIGRAYRRGRTPRPHERWWANWKARRVKKIWKEEFGGRGPEPRPN